MVNSKPSISSSLESRLNQSHHFLISLELGLQNSAQKRQIRKKPYLRRIAFIREQIKRVKQLHSVVSESESFDKNQQNFGLPDFGLCTPEERSITCDFLHGRREALKAIGTQSLQILGWAEKAVERSSFSFMNIFRLSSLKKIMNRLDVWIAELEYEDQTIDQQISKIARLSKSGQNLESNLNGLVVLFGEIDRLGSRIHRLKETIAESEKVIANMEHWLHQNNAQSVQPEIPRPLITNEHQVLRDLAANFRTDPLVETHKRLSLAKNYIKDCLDRVSNQTNRPTIDRLVDKKNNSSAPPQKISYAPPVSPNYASENQMSGGMLNFMYPKPKAEISSTTRKKRKKRRK